MFRSLCREGFYTKILKYFKTATLVTAITLQALELHRLEVDRVHFPKLYKDIILLFKISLPYPCPSKVTGSSIFNYFNKNSGLIKIF